MNEEEYFDAQSHWQVNFSSWSKPEQAMQQCVSRLPARMSQLFMLSEFDDMNSEDICQLMSISSMNNF